MSHTAFKVILLEELPVTPHRTQDLWRDGQNYVVQTFCRILGMRNYGGLGNATPCPIANTTGNVCLTHILRRSRTGTVWFYTSTSNKRAARPKLHTKSLTRELKRMYSRLTLVRISIKL